MVAIDTKEVCIALNGFLFHGNLYRARVTVQMFKHVLGSYIYMLQLSTTQMRLHQTIIVYCCVFCIYTVHTGICGSKLSVYTCAQ